MSEFLENFTIEDLITPTAEQSSSTTISLPDLDISSMNLDFDSSDFPDFSDHLSLPSVDSSVASCFDTAFNLDTELFNNSGSSFNSFASSNMDQFAPQQFMPMYPPQYSYPTPAFGYQPPPGSMLVPAPGFYAQQTMMPVMPMMQPPMQMPTQNPSFSFAPPPDAPAFSNFGVGVDEPEPMSDITVSTPIRRSRRTAGKKTTYQDSPGPSPTPVKRRKVSRPKKVETTAFELAAPLSVLTADSDMPLKNMITFSSRSVAVRLAEAKKAGKILRPSNAFMCYRSAYSDRIKQWASDDSHQTVSRVAGASWKLEPENVRNLYTHSAELDKINHLTAFPGYKFNPKLRKASRSARAASPETDDQPIPTPNKKQLARIPANNADDEVTSLFGESSTPTPSKYNLHRRS